MPLDTYHVDVHATSAHNGGSLVVSFASGTATIAEDRIPRSMPASIPRSQEYFWSALWQEGERAADADFAAGRTRRFEDPTDAVRWLLSDEDA